MTAAHIDLALALIALAVLIALPIIAYLANRKDA